MKTKMSKAKDQTEATGTTIRVRKPTKSVALAKLKEINQKQLGRKLKVDELLTFAINRLTAEDVKALQELSLSNEDRKKIMRQKYIEIHGPISEDEFTGFTFSPEFQTFLREHFSANMGDTSWMAISLNYDMLLEQALFRRPVPFYYPEMNAGLVGDKQGVPLFKIHGSINWFPCPTHPLHTENPTPEQKRRATTRMTWDETNKRFSIDFPDVFVSSYDLVYQELVREDELLKSPVMAHYGPRKPVDVNFPFIDGVRSSTLRHVEEVERAFIIGVRPPNEADDPVLSKIFQSLKGKNVAYVNPSKDDCDWVASSFGFSTFQGTFERWLV